VLLDYEVVFVGAGDYAAAEDFGDDAGRVAGAVDAMLGLLIGGQALGVESAEAGLVAEERATSHGHAAGEEDIGGSVEPDNGDAGGAKELGGTGLCVGAAAECEDHGFFMFEGTAEDGAELIGFELAEGGFAEAFEHFGDAQAGSFFDAIVEIDEAPGELAGEECTDGGLAGAHEASEAKKVGAGLLGPGRRLRHCVLG
jgi:hypothetical protein